MTGPVASIRAQIEARCIVGTIGRSGCSVSLAEAMRPRLIVDFDKPGSPGGVADKRCDYLFLSKPAGGSLWVVPVELKKGKVESGEAIKQLRAGAKAAESLVSKAMATKAKFRPVLASGRIHKNERSRLRNQKVKFHGHSEAVRRLRCGAPLTDALCIDDKKK